MHPTGAGAASCGDIILSLDPPAPAQNQNVDAIITISNNDKLELYVDARSSTSTLRRIVQTVLSRKVKTIQGPVTNLRVPMGTLKKSDYVMWLERSTLFGPLRADPNVCSQTFTVSETGGQVSSEILRNVCRTVSEKDGKKKTCEECFLNRGGAWTALGCIEITPDKFIQKFLSFGVSVGGGIAFLLVLFGGFQVLTSAGNPERLIAGKELVGAAISGLLLIIFSLFLLRLVGLTILGLPGFE